MAKRFIDTNIFSDEWFMDLSPEAKLLYIYFFTNCDHAGIINVNWKLIEFQTGIKQLRKSYDSLTEELRRSIVRLPKELHFFLPRFIEFQYPGFPNSRVKQQISAIKRLVELGIYDADGVTLTKEYRNSYVYNSSYVNIEGEFEGEKPEPIIYNKIYDKFIKETDSEIYHAFVKFLFGIKPNIKKMERCLSLGDQIDHERFQELMKLYQKELIKAKVEAMENKIDLTKKYKSFYLTLKNWCKAG